ncbi:MAG: GrpB family protein [Actinomycetota bacterium]|nr:GrpB family protein [Actinomycetota bacterium]
MEEPSQSTRHEHMTEDQLRDVTIGEPQVIGGTVELVEYDRSWPELFAREARRIECALGRLALRIEHVGSTSIPGLAAKPIIDILLVVTDSADENGYAGALSATGYVLRIREPDWYQHRMFKGEDPIVNLHVFSEGCPEIERMLLFRDWIRHNKADCALYERTKRELAGREWKYVQNYADAKGAVVEEIIGRARACRHNSP